MRDVSERRVRSALPNLGREDKPGVRQLGEWIRLLSWQDSRNTQVKLLIGHKFRVITMEATAAVQLQALQSCGALGHPSRT